MTTRRSEWPVWLKLLDGAATGMLAAMCVAVALVAAGMMARAMWAFVLAGWEMVGRWLW